jgi:DNA-binding NtrC family response regulator
MLEALKSAVRAGKTATPVCITGEHNTGRKSLVRIIDNGRKCSDKPLITIDAAIMAPVQLEVELFGRPLSAPSDEIGLSRGKLERGQGSNLHIANIECLTPLQQANLHLWMTGNETMRRGKNSSCRLIASTTPAISDAIQKGLFRKDLWYALSVCHIQVPSLVERREDIPLLCERIITNICVTRKLPRPTLLRQALEMILDHSWPGNLSELENVLEYAITHTNDRLIGPKEMPHLQSRGLHNFLNKGPTVNPLGSTTIDEITKATLVAALEACGGNRRRASQRLRVSLRTVYNMIQRYELAAPRKGGSANKPKD